MAFQQRIIFSLSLPLELQSGSAITFTSFPIVPKDEPLRAQTKHSTHRTETLMGTTRLKAFAGVLTAVPVGRKSGSGETVAAAVVAGPMVDARILAGTMAVSQQTLVDI